MVDSSKRKINGNLSKWKYSTQFQAATIKVFIKKVVQKKVWQVGGRKLWLSWKNKFGKEVFYASFILLVGCCYCCRHNASSSSSCLFLRGGVGGSVEGKEQKVFYCYEK